MRSMTPNIPRHRLRLHSAIYRPDSFVLMLRYCANLEAIRYESTSLNRIIADKSLRVIVALKSMKRITSTSEPLKANRKDDLVLNLTPEKQDKTSELNKHWSPGSTPARNEVIMKTTYPVN